MSTYKYNTEQLYQATDAGLEIIKKYLGDCYRFADALQNNNKHFNMRATDNDKTSSAMLIAPGKVISKTDNTVHNYWRVNDFGNTSYTPISLAMEKSGLEFYDCLKMLYEWFNIDGSKGVFFKPEVDFKNCEKNDERPAGWFNIVVKDTCTNLDQIGRFITDATASKFHFFSVDFYEKVFINGKTNEKCYMKTTATDNYPIFAYMPDGNVWAKTYAPNAGTDEKGRKYKHGYLGKKPDRYVHGLQQILDEIEIEEIDELIKQIANTNSPTLKSDLIAEKEDLMAKEVIICSGGSDGMNVDTLGYNAIWFNSEAEKISFAEYTLIKKYVKNIYNLPDVDAAGLKYGYEVAEDFWNMKSIWLPKEKLGTNGKDFRDWMQFYKSANVETIKYQFANLILGALKMKFFDRNAKTKTLKINTAYLHYFLKIKGFYLYYPDKVYLDKTSEQEYIFIRVIDNVVNQEFANTMKKFCERYMIEKGQPVEVINLIKNTTQFTDKNLLGLDSLVLEFKNFTENSQRFYFKNQFANITKEGIVLQEYKKLDTHIWTNKRINHIISDEKPFFDYTTDENGTMKLEILRTDCEYMNFLINTSRMHWKKEYQAFDKNTDGLATYKAENKFRLTSEHLTPEENQNHTQHYLSKMFSLGYMCHRYKIDSFARLLYIMDDTERDSEDERNGGTGKTMILKGLDPLLKPFKIDGSLNNLFQNPFILGSLSKDHDYIRIDDYSQNYKLAPIYVWITDGATVRPIYKASFDMPFEDFPKMALTRNFGLAQTDGSDTRRVLFLSNSDFYHSKTKEFEKEHRVAFDFGHDLFKWDDKSKQPSIHFNFLMQCLQLYFKYRDNELLAPQKNIDLNNSLTGIGDTFKNWADSYFIEDFYDDVMKEMLVGTLNTHIRREDMMFSYMKAAGKMPKNPTNFKKSLKEYCNLVLHDKEGNITKQKWEYNPTDVQGYNAKTKNIYKRVGNNVDEHFFIRIIKLGAPPAEKQTEINLDTETDLPF